MSTTSKPQWAIIGAATALTMTGVACGMFSGSAQAQPRNCQVISDAVDLDLWRMTRALISLDYVSFGIAQ
ncbi:hypothetical protein J5X84_08145 [Streptosporangiaceae bacterium NEAU-GS5]|nr:hypothetical protein [Streptosporangiaceae bacterium NEAU-GS5]